MRKLTTVSVRALFALLPLFASRSEAQVIEPGKTGETLAAALRSRFKPDPSKVLSYREARREIFGRLDNASGKVRCVYTGVLINVAPGTLPNDREMNVEHTWPQSFFDERHPMKSDLHHLFPTLSKVNNARATLPLQDVTDVTVTRWFRDSVGQPNIPDRADRDAFSEFHQKKAFEPREDHKGNVARALIYFLVVYGDRADTRDRLPISRQRALLAWHRGDPADAAEKAREAKIKAVQGNDNPFVLDPTLFERVLEGRGPAPTRFLAEAKAAAAETPATARVAAWNAEAMFDVSEVARREADLRKFADAVKPDVILIEEVTSLEVVREIRDAMGLRDYFAACSDFNQDDDRRFASFEVGIISKFPLEDVVEFDPTPDQTGAVGEPEEERLQADPEIGVVPVNVETMRGFLRARVPALKMFVSVVHLKSSRGRTGRSDRLNAMEREYVAAVVASRVKIDLDEFPNHFAVVGGDFNVGAADAAKNGEDLDTDNFRPDRPGDRYDETHALFGSGLIDGLRMKNLTIGVGETFAGFPGRGPIDNLYALPGRSARIALPAAAQKTTERFGSDHQAVFADFHPE